MPGPLSKAHAALGAAGQCQKCHVSEAKVEARRCLACHEPVSRRMAGRKGAHREVTGDCEACHAEHQGSDADIRPLDPASFEHQAETGFALTGGHLPLARQCARCHTTRSYLQLNPQCSSCHRDGHDGGLGADCLTCHTAGVSFQNASRAFHKAGRFPLEGRHLAVRCASCHLNGVISGTPTRCYDCHWIRRQDDRYRTQLGIDCQTCHRPTAWTAVRWNHGASTGVALNASHRTLACESCHAGQTFKGTAPACVSCHQADYQRAANPNHQASGFPTTCNNCHLPSHSAWSQAAFGHQTVFTLVGVHALQPCSACHKNNVYRGTPRECVGCHLADYQKTTAPNHQAAGFSTACNSCHRPTDASFKGTAVNHSSFLLVGVHATQACSACHKNNVYKGTPRECVGCHLADYQRTTAPNHQAAGFPTACDSCHRPTDASWRQAVFNHTWFPITSGRHAGRLCVDCHKDPSNFRVFTCLTCHTLSSVQGEHSGNPAFRYDSQACYSCHPQGRG